MKATGINRFYEDCAWFAALLDYMCDHKTDHDADAELAEMLNHKPWLSGILVGVLTTRRKET
jgi:hypothetical protein